MCLSVSNISLEHLAADNTSSCLGQGSVVFRRAQASQILKIRLNIEEALQRNLYTQPQYIRIAQLRIACMVAILKWAIHVFY